MVLTNQEGQGLGLILAGFLGDQRLLGIVWSSEALAISNDQRSQVFKFGRYD